MCSKHDSLKAFYKALSEHCFTEGQKKAILLSLNKRQRFGIAELIINVLIGNLELSDERAELLTNYRDSLRKIARHGKDITNKQLSRNYKAVLLVLKIALKTLEEEEVKETENEVNNTVQEKGTDSDKDFETK
jgi:hypothetical protein